MDKEVPTTVARNRPGSTQETNAPGALPEPPRPKQVWRHPASGEEVILQWDPLYGSVQHAAFARVGFEYVRDAKPEEVTTLEQASIDAENSKLKDNASREDVKNVVARVQAVEAENARLKAQLNRTSAPDATEISGEHAKEEAIRNTEARGAGNTGDVEASGGVNATTAPTTDAKAGTSNKKEGK